MIIDLTTIWLIFSLAWLVWCIVNIYKAKKVHLVIRLVLFVILSPLFGFGLFAIAFEEILFSTIDYLYNGENTFGNRWEHFKSYIRS